MPSQKRSNSENECHYRNGSCSPPKSSRQSLRLRSKERLNCVEDINANQENIKSKRSSSRSTPKKNILKDINENITPKKSSISKEEKNSENKEDNFITPRKSPRKINIPKSPCSLLSDLKIGTPSRYEKISEKFKNTPTSSFSKYNNDVFFNKVLIIVLLF